MSIRRLAAALISVIGLSLVAGTAAQAKTVNTIGRLPKSVHFYGPETPFPLKADFPFPWETIEGVWEAKGNAINAIFSFEVQVDCDERKILRVLQLDPASGVVLAQGTGIGIDDKHIVRAAMTGDVEPYMLFIGAFRGPRGGVVNVLTMRPFVAEHGNDHMAQVTVRKLSDAPVIRKTN